MVDGVGVWIQDDSSAWLRPRSCRTDLQRATAPSIRSPRPSPLRSVGRVTDTPHVLVRDEPGELGAVRVVTMNRIDALNAFGNRLMHELATALRDADDATGVSVIVLAGNGRAFTAGADLKAMGGTDEPFELGWTDLLDIVIGLTKPFLVAAHGTGAGVGMTILGLADLAVVGSDARFRCPFSELGLNAEAASTRTFARRVGHQRAFWMLQSSTWFTGAELAEAGLAFEHRPAERVLDRTMELAQHLASMPLQSLVATKELMVGPDRDALRAAGAAENETLARLIGTPANLAALERFRSRRP